jgi:membrane-associated PAP2 superfamily phosphatase
MKTDWNNSKLSMTLEVWSLIKEYRQFLKFHVYEMPLVWEILKEEVNYGD